MAGILRAVVLGDQGGRADDHVAHAALAAAVAVPVSGGKELHQHAGEVHLAVEEDILVGDKHVVEHGQGLHAAILGVAQVDVRPALQLSGVAGLAAHNHGDAGGVQRDVEGDGVVLLPRPHGLGGETHHLVGVGDAGQMAFGAVDHYAVWPALHYV